MQMKMASAEVRLLERRAQLASCNYFKLIDSIWVKSIWLRVN